MECKDWKGITYSVLVTDPAANMIQLPQARYENVRAVEWAGTERQEYFGENSVRHTHARMVEFGGSHIIAAVEYPVSVKAETVAEDMARFFDSFLLLEKGQ